MERLHGDPAAAAGDEASQLIHALAKEIELIAAPCVVMRVALRAARRSDEVVVEIDQGRTRARCAHSGAREQCKHVAVESPGRVVCS
eukprot:5707208-Prymnesium_polylepis.3